MLEGYCYTHWLQICLGKKLKFETIFLQFQGAVSRTTAPILGLFVLTWTCFLCWIQIWLWQFEFWNFSGEITKFWLGKVLMIYTLARTTHTKSWNLKLVSRNSKGYLKNHCTNTRLVCTHLNAFFMLNPKKAMNFENFWKSWTILTCHLHSTSTWLIQSDKTWQQDNRVNCQREMIKFWKVLKIKAFLCTTQQVNVREHIRICQIQIIDISNNQVTQSWIANFSRYPRELMNWINCLTIFKEANCLYLWCIAILLSSVDSTEC